MSFDNVTCVSVGLMHEKANVIDSSVDVNLDVNYALFNDNLDKITLKDLEKNHKLTRVWCVCFSNTKRKTVLDFQKYTLCSVFDRVDDLDKARKYG